MSQLPLATTELARRLERAEARCSASYVESRARLQPELGAEWRILGGAYAMYDGAASPLTQSFALGLDGVPTDRELADLESFFLSRGAPVFHEVSPLAEPALLGVLNARGYRPVEFTSVLYGLTSRLAPARRGEGGVHARPIRPGEESTWAEVAGEGWSEYPELGAFMRQFGRVSAASDLMRCFLAERDGRPIAAAALGIVDGVALLAGASTVPDSRGLGAQRALLEARLRFAAEGGCEIAMMGAQPGSRSQRNAERQGFRIAYTRIKWHLSPPAA